MEITLNEAVLSVKYKQLAACDDRTLRRKAEKVRKFVSTTEDPELLLEDILRATVLTDSFTAFLLTEVGVCVPDHLLSRFHQIASVYIEVKDMMMKNRGGTDADRYMCNRAAVQTAKRAGLDIDKRGDITLLSQAVGSCRKYAAQILQAIRDGNEESLFHRSLRQDSIKATNWPQELAEYAKQTSNSRACPGFEKVRIAFKTYAPKFLLVRRRAVVIQDFLRANPACNFSTSTLSREFPPNVVTASERDKQRNICPTHSNGRSLQAALNKHLQLNLPGSVRLLCSMILCKPEGVDALQPLTWREDCVYRKCPTCPKYNTPVSADLAEVRIQLALWGTKVDPVKGKKINNYHNYDMSLKEVAAKFDRELPMLALHCFTAAKQWECCKLTRQNLEPNVVTTIEDYQQVPCFFIAIHFNICFFPESADISP